MTARWLLALVSVGTALFVAGCDSDSGDRGRSAATATSATAQVLAGVVERDGDTNRPAVDPPYGSLRGVRGEGGGP
jgi:hypothetical protein